MQIFQSSKENQEEIKVCLCNLGLDNVKAMMDAALALCHPCFT